jgi:HAD superfamily hydrolase (TIGR01509 family)
MHSFALRACFCSEEAKHMPRTPEIKAVVFDLDGLLFNTEELYQDCGGEILRRRGCEFTPELLDKMMGRPSAVALQIMIDHCDLSATVPQLEQETDEIFAGLFDTRLAPMPGAVELLDAIETAGLPKGIATSSRRAFVDNVLSRFDWAPRFHTILSAESVARGKPNPDIYLAAAAQLNVSPKAMMVLEDSENGCKAAVASGAFTVAVPSGHTLRHTFEGAAIKAEDLADFRIYQALRFDA